MWSFPHVLVILPMLLLNALKNITRAAILPFPVPQKPTRKWNGVAVIGRTGFAQFNLEVT
jgi:hypothetical protein